MEQTYDTCCNRIIFTSCEFFQERKRLKDIARNLRSVVIPFLFGETRGRLAFLLSAYFVNLHHFLIYFQIRQSF